MQNRTRTLAISAAYAPNTGAGAGATGDANGAGASGQQQQQQSGDGAGGTPTTFEALHAALPDEHKAIVDGHISGLKSALESERSAKSTLEKELREAAKAAKDVPDLQTKLTGMADAVKTESARADFFEQAHAAGVTNLRLAWITAREDQMFKANGQPDFEGLKQKYPELFGTKTTANVNAGAGAGQGTQDGKTDMNSLLRRAAGIKT